MTDPVILAGRAIAFLLGMAFLLGVALCAVQVPDAEGRKSSAARRALRAISSSLRALMQRQTAGN